MALPGTSVLLKSRENGWGSGEKNGEKCVLVHQANVTQWLSFECNAYRSGDVMQVSEIQIPSNLRNLWLDRQLNLYLSRQPSCEDR